MMNLFMLPAAFLAEKSGHKFAFLRAYAFYVRLPFEDREYFELNAPRNMGKLFVVAFVLARYGVDKPGVLLMASIMILLSICINVANLLVGTMK